MFNSPPSVSELSFQAILKEYPAVLQTSPQQPVKHTVTHHIQTTGPPTHSATGIDKTWTVDYGLDYGMEPGLNNGLNCGPETDSRIQILV